MQTIPNDAALTCATFTVAFAFAFSVLMAATLWMLWMFP